MLAVAAHAPSNPEAQVVLGVLYNISQDFDNATECFSRAIDLSPPDYTLLNKVINRQVWTSMDPFVKDFSPSALCVHD